MLPWRPSDPGRSILWPTKREKERDKQRRLSKKASTPSSSERATGGRGSRYSTDTIADNEDYDGDNSEDEPDAGDNMSWGSGEVPRALPRPPSPPYRPCGKSLSKFASSHQRAVLELRDRKDQVQLDHEDRMQQLDQRRQGNEQAAMQRIEEWKAGLRDAGANEPSWPSDARNRTSSLADQQPRRRTRPAALESSTDEPAFLYNNLPDAGLELRVRTLTLRVSVAIRTGNLSKADTLVTEALSVAAKLDYPPIVAKCRYWEAVLRHSQGRRQDAARAIVLAQPCVGRYIEGEEAAKWRHKYRHVIAELGLE